MVMEKNLTVVRMVMVKSYEPNGDKENHLVKKKSQARILVTMEISLLMVSRSMLEPI